MELHGTVGPARTTVSDVAERAGVQRHTYYRHFPDDRSLFLACSGLYAQRNPLPDPEPWRAIADSRTRLRRALGELYEYFEQNEAMLSNVVRDAEVVPVLREIAQVRRVPAMQAMFDVLAEALPRRRKKQRATLALALDFGTWRVLVRRNGLSSRQAADLMADLVLCA